MEKDRAFEITPLYYKKQHNYLVNNRRGETVASFHTLHEAALVGRYITGADMTEAEREEAIKAIKEYDARGMKSPKERNDNDG